MARDEPPTSHSLVIERSDDFRVSARTYHDPAIYQEELRRVFYDSWVYLCHDSELPNPGDFKSTPIGEKPVLVVRDQSGTLNAFLNACTHRGAALCREEYGNNKLLVCPYHAWTFKLTGELQAVPDRERFPDSFTIKGRDLVKLPRLESYGGLVFGSFNPAVQPLGDFLGLARKYIDQWNARSADGKFTVGRSNKYSYHGNWKFQSENVVDGYHPHVVHRAAFSMMRKFAMADAKAAADSEAVEAEGVGKVDPGSHTTAFVTDKSIEGGVVRGLGGGHSTLEAGMVFESAYADPVASKAYMERVVEMFGKEMAPSILFNRHLMIFPNLALMDHLIRVWHPLAVDRTEILSYPLRNAALDRGLDEARLLDVQMNYSPAGAVAPDDAAIFAAIRTGLRSSERAMFTISRGLGKEVVAEDGERVGVYSDEIPQRSFWRQWNAMMTGPAATETIA